MSGELQQYVAVGFLLLAAAGMVVAMLLTPKILGKKRVHGAIKDTRYECGMPAETEAHTRFNVKFYLIAMLFILFDIEVVFLYPWAVVYRDMLDNPATKDLILAAAVSFVSVLLVGYIYALKKRAFDWKD